MGTNLNVFSLLYYMVLFLFFLFLSSCVSIVVNPLCTVGVLFSYIK